MAPKEFSGDFLQWLRGFYHLARTRSFSRAAQAMCRNQGTLTYQIKRLEDDLGVTLVDRKVAPVRLTEKGLLLYEIALEIFGLLRKIQTEVASDGILSGNVLIMCNYGISARYIPRRLHAFKELYPEISVTVMPERSAELIHGLIEPDIDFIITRDDFLVEPCQFTPLFESSLALVVHESIRFPGGEPAVEDLAGLSYIATPEGTIDKSVSDLLRQSGHEVRIARSESYFLSSLQYVALNMGATVMDGFLAGTPGFAVNVHDLSRLVPKQAYGIAIRQNQYVSPQARKLIEFLRTEDADGNML